MTARKNGLRSDLARADARGVTAEDLAETPEVSREEFASAKPHIGGVEVKRGRPKLAEPKVCCVGTEQQKKNGKPEQFETIPSLLPASCACSCVMKLEFIEFKSAIYGRLIHNVLLFKGDFKRCRELKGSPKFEDYLRQGEN